MYTYICAFFNNVGTEAAILQQAPFARQRRAARAAADRASLQGGSTLAGSRAPFRESLQLRIMEYLGRILDC